jgi:hypothetical protein
MGGKAHCVLGGAAADGEDGRDAAQQQSQGPASIDSVKYGISRSRITSRLA